jgi:DNA-binding transcriptional ArsR family regulator
MRNSSTVTAEPKGSARLFAALGDPTRLRLVSRLCDSGPMSITRLTEGSSVTRQAISKHLKVMKGSGLVRCTRRGRESVWQLNQRRLEEARRYLDMISKQWDAALGRLREFVED